jgi:hypothetical protein
MKRVRRSEIIAFLLLILALAAAIAQEFQRGGSNRDRRDWERVRSQRRYDPRKGVEMWELPETLPDDVFTFARVKYDSYGRSRRGGNWQTDWPDSDLNFSMRLEQLTSLRVSPTGAIVELTDPELSQYPFLYMIEPGRISLTDPEREALRNHLLHGGFLMVDDFWGFREWDYFYEEIKQVFPNREPEEIPIEHEIFSCVFDIKEKPQIPAIQVALWYGITYEPDKAGSEEVHYKALYDDAGRMMAIICHNTDLGDGWEREGEDPWYFRNFSEPKAYPMGINIVFYALTH